QPALSPAQSGERARSGYRGRARGDLPRPRFRRDPRTRRQAAAAPALSLAPALGSRESPLLPVVPPARPEGSERLSDLRQAERPACGADGKTLRSRQPAAMVDPSSLPSPREHRPPASTSGRRGKRSFGSRIALAAALLLLAGVVLAGCG